MTIEATHLGQQSSYPQKYSPEVLVAVPRKLNREQYGLEDDALPFQGVDVWHAYEFSFLTQNGVPVVGVLKIVYPCTNEFLVESKSLKLYLNSFNMDYFGSNSQEGRLQVTAIIKKDLESLLKCQVEVNCFDHKVETAPSDFEEYQILEESLKLEDLNCDEYTENPELLVGKETECDIKWGTHLLRSNCKITHQPDWGSIYISMKGNRLPNMANFLKYIVSLRNENHFHEEICEMVYTRLMNSFNPKNLTITCLYTRRGGIDICPVRTNESTDLSNNLINPGINNQSVFRQ